jgi:NADPH-dependent curcumin reductase CurA
MANLNQQWRLIARPTDEAGREHFRITEEPIPEPGPGEVLVRNIYLFVPPSMRLWMNEKDSYFPAQVLGEVMMGITLGVVEKSNVPGLEPGTYVNGMGGWQQWSVAPGAALQPLAPHPGVPLELYRTVLDVQGLTAFVGVMDVCKPQPGETVVVTAAAGSVGSLACQLAKTTGARVIGVAGGPEKCRWLVEECGVDGAIDYRAGDVGKRLDELAPKGIDAVFENVGGPVMDLILDRINDRARIALCGLVSSYNTGGTQSTMSLMQLVNRAAVMQGFLCKDYLHRYGDMLATMQPMVLAGTLKYHVDILEGGLESTLEAMHRISTGANQGPQLVKISSP